MITFSKLGRMGDIGNAMFQLAAVYSVSIKNNYELKIPIIEPYYNNITERTYNPLTYGFNINIPKLDGSEKFEYIYEEMGFKFSDNIFLAPDGTDFQGHFQSELYFEHCKDKVLELFSFNERILDECINYVNNIDFSDTISMHVRRGDYLKHPTIHPQMKENYYNKALEQSECKNILIFSDDINYCKLAYNNTTLERNVYYSENNNPFVDMCLMSLCRDNIIVNSSFSWWGAYLNSNPNKKVFGPEEWFGPNGYKNYEDIIPKSWIKL